MKKIILITGLSLVTFSAFSTDYLCNDGGTLSMNRINKNTFYASLDYKNHSSSELERIVFGAKVPWIGVMQSDNSRILGTAESVADGMILKFNTNQTVSCHMENNFKEKEIQK